MRRAIIAVAVLLLGPAGGAYADPITLTSGTLSIHSLQSFDGGLGSFSFSGPDFEAGGFGMGTLGFNSFGADTSLSGSAVAVFANNGGARGSVTIDGQTLSGYAAATLQVTSEPLIVSGMSGTARFSATGLVELYSHFLGDSIFSGEVNGSGTLQIAGIRKPNGVLLTDSIQLTFEPPTPTSPTPEPGSMLLLGTGLAAAWKSRRLRLQSVMSPPDNC